MTEKTEDQLLAASKQAMADQENLDQNILDGLAQARSLALASLAEEKSRTSALPAWVAGGATATLFVAAMFFYSTKPAEEDSMLLMADLEFLQSDDLEIVENDIDFYVWLEEQADVEG